MENSLPNLPQRVAMDEACPKCGADDGIAGKCAAMFVAQKAEIASLRAQIAEVRRDAGESVVLLGGERDCLRAELAANNELYSISQSDLAAAALQYDAATAVIERLEAAARHDAEALDRYRYAIAFAAADSWDGGPDMRQRLEWARASDPGGNLTNDRVAEIGQIFPTHMRAIPRQDAEEKARLRSIATAAVDYLNAIDKRCRSDDFDFKLKFDAGLVPISEYTTRLRAALACRPQQASHDPFRCEACRADGYCSRPEGCLACRPQAVLQPLTADQKEYLQSIERTIGDYDPSAVIGRPQPEAHTPAHGPFPGAPFSPKVERS